MSRRVDAILDSVLKHADALFHSSYFEMEMSSIQVARRERAESEAAATGKLVFEYVHRPAVGLSKRDPVFHGYVVAGSAADVDGVLSVYEVMFS